MKTIKITAIRRIEHTDLIAKYENPIPHACEVSEGMTWISTNGEMPPGFCPEAWKTVGEFALRLANGEENLFDGWMKNPRTAMISCNDGFRPVSFYIEVVTPR